MTCNFHKQSPWEEARCSFESHDFGSLLHPGYILFFFSCSLILYSPLPSVLPLPPPRAHIHKQMGISKKLKSHFWLQFNPFLFSFSPQSFWHRNGQFMTAKLSEHTSAHIYPWQFLLTRWEVFFASCLMWYRYFLSPDKCTVISLQTKYSGMTILWKREWGKAMWRGVKKGQSLHSQGNACEYLPRHFSKAFCLSCVK